MSQEEAVERIQDGRGARGPQLTRRAVLALAAVALAGCSTGGSGQDASEPDDNPAEAEVKEPTLDDRAAEVVAGLTLEQKVSQLFFVSPESVFAADPVVAAGETSREALSQHPVGGICYFAKNLVDPDQTRQMLANVSQFSQEACGLPLFLSVDEEGGTVARVASNEAFGVDNMGNMCDVGATGDPQKAYDACHTMAGYLADLGFNLDFAPVCDIVNGTSATMAKRSFGSSAEVVTPMVEAAVKGFLEGGVQCSAKHFPGIGNAEGDSETEPIVTHRTADQLEAEEYRPFEAAIAAGVPFVMVGHIAVPEVTGDDTPASLSRTMVTDVLRGQLGYQGIVITDSLGMGALSAYITEDRVVRALAAGADMLLMPADFQTAFDAVLAAVQAGTISQDQVDESVTRIAKLKLALQG